MTPDPYERPFKPSPPRGPSWARQQGVANACCPPEKMCGRHVAFPHFLSVHRNNISRLEVRQNLLYMTNSAFQSKLKSSLLQIHSNYFKTNIIYVFINRTGESHASLGDHLKLQKIRTFGQLSVTQKTIRFWMKLANKKTPGICWLSRRQSTEIVRSSKILEILKIW